MTAALWCYPDSTRAGGGGLLTLEEILFPSLFRDLEVTVRQVGAVSEAQGGFRPQTIRQNVLRVRLTVDRVSVADHAGKARALRTLESHLRRGGVIAVAGDKSKAWAGYATKLPQRSDEVIRTSGNPWSALSGSTQQVAAGDEIVISSASPESYREWQEVDEATYGGVDRITLADPVVYSPALLPVLLRHWAFFPALVMEDPNQTDPIVTSEDRGLTYSLDVDLIEHIPTLARAAKFPAGYYLRSANGGSF